MKFKTNLEKFKILNKQFNTAQKLIKKNKNKINNLNNNNNSFLAKIHNFFNKITHQNVKDKLLKVIIPVGNIDNNLFYQNSNNRGNLPTLCLVYANSTNKLLTDLKNNHNNKIKADIADWETSFNQLKTEMYKKYHELGGTPTNNGIKRTAQQSINL